MKGFDTKQQANTAMELALGRILRMGARETKAGDIEEYYRCRDIIFDSAEYLGRDTTAPYEHSYQRDRINY
jgi:hypothetical protein